MSNEEKRLQNSEPYHVRNKKHSQSDALVNDSGPIAGIGDSLIELEKRLDSIDADLYFQLNKDEGHAEL